MKKKYIILVLMLVLTIVSINKTYSYYYRRMSVNVTSTSSEIKCDAELQEVNDSEKGPYGYAEFKVIVKNTENNELTGEPFNYTLTFEDTTNSNIIFGYNNVFNSNLTIQGSLSNDEERTDSYIIHVKSTNGSSENVGYKVNLKCVQQY